MFLRWKWLRRAGSSPSIFLFVLLSSLTWVLPARGQEEGGETRGDALRVFLDCSSIRCNSTYFRTEIEFVNWVQQPEDAQIHLIMTSLVSGSGGREFRFDFIGREDLESQDDGLTYTSSVTDTTDEDLQGISRVLGAGLARYSALIGRAPDIELRASEAERPTDRLVTSEEVEDPWNFWVFDVGLNASMNGEDTSSRNSFNGSMGASRTTTLWKVSFNAFGSFRRNEFELSDGEVRVDKRTNWNTNALVVYSLAEHTSIGFRTSADASTRRNQTFGATFRPGFEYSYFPYEESPRKALTAFYEIGVRHFSYEEETIFGKTQETRPQQILTLRLFQRQPWGSSTVTVTGRQFLHDLTKNSFEVSGNLNLRVTRGLSVNFGGAFELVGDQLFLSADGITDEEILLGRLARATDKEYRFNVGFNYRFGSIFNNIVNNRF